MTQNIAWGLSEIRTYCFVSGDKNGMQRDALELLPTIWVCQERAFWSPNLWPLNHWKLVMNTTGWNAGFLAGFLVCWISGDIPTLFPSFCFYTAVSMISRVVCSHFRVNELSTAARSSPAMFPRFCRGFGGFIPYLPILTHTNPYGVSPQVFHQPWLSNGLQWLWRHGDSETFLAHRPKDFPPWGWTLCGSPRAILASHGHGRNPPRKASGGGPVRRWPGPEIAGEMIRWCFFF